MKKIFIIPILLVLLSGFINADILVNQTSNGVNAVYVGANSGVTRWQGQSFIIKSDYLTYNIINTSWICGSGSGTVTELVMKIENCDGSDLPNGVLVHANATKTLTSFTCDGATWNTFTYNSTFTLNNNTKYCLVITGGSVGGTNYVFGREDAGDPYSNGIASFYDGSWNARNIQDIPFKVEGTTTTPSTTSFHRVKITNNWTGSNLVGVNVSLNNSVSNLTQADGIAYFNNLSGNFNYNASLPNYFNVSGVAVENTTVSNNMFQSQINISVTELFTGIPVNNVSVFVNGSLVFNTTSYWGLIYPNVADYNVTQVIDNSGNDIFHITNVSFSVAAFDNKTHTVRVHQHILNVTAKDIRDNSTISTFTINISSLNRTDVRQKSTTNNLTQFNVIHDTYNVSIIAAAGFALNSPDGSFNNSELVTITADTQITFFLYPVNSINFTFYDEETPLVLLNDTNITMNLLDGGSQNFSTSVGWIFVENLSVNDYEARYKADGYNPRSFFFSVTADSTQQIRLYLSLTNQTEQWIIRTADENDNDIVSAVVRLQQQFVDENGQFVTVEECETNSDGRCDMFINEQADIFYRFIVLIGDEIVLTTVPSPIFVLVGQVRLMTLRVTLGSKFLDPDTQQLGLFSAMTYNNITNVVNYTWIDSNNAITRGCLVVNRRILPSMIYISVSETCFNGFSGDLSSNLTLVLLNNSEVQVLGVVDFTNNRQVLESISIITFSTGVGKSLSFIGSDELLLTAFGFLIVSGATILIPSLLIQSIINFGLLTVLSALGFNKLGLSFTIGFMVLAMFIGWSNRQNRGVD